MKTTIFYFSATGNSLSIARSIAVELGETELMAIPEVMQGNVDVSASRLGLVFPVYAWGLPRMVADFVKKLTVRPEQYIFAIATCSGTPAGTLLQLQKLLQAKGVELSAGFSVTEPTHTLLKENALIRFMRSINGGSPQSWKERFPEILAVIKDRQKHKLETSSLAANVIGNILHEPAIKSFKTLDRDFWVDEHCNHCGTCERICPRHNITIEEDHPVWHHNCELCFACLAWCPQAAIQYQQHTLKKPRTHHPDVTRDDFIVR